MQSQRRTRQRGIALILLTLMLATVILPMMALGIDLSVLYAVRTRLSAAVDGAALAAGRSLDPTKTFNSQQTKLTNIANQFLAANFPADYWGSVQADGIPDNITATQVNARVIIQVTAARKVPLLFARIFNQDYATVSATATAARRFVRLVLVLDRSSSMSGTPISELRTAAKNFVANFSPTRDDLGLVVYGGSAIVAYPARDPTILGGGGLGPDGGFLDATSGIPVMIDQIQAGSNTGTTEGLVLAHQELRKDWVNHALFLNVIVLFTDGMPNGFTAGFNGSNGARLYPSEVLTPGANTVIKQVAPHCNNFQKVNLAATQILGWMAQGGGYANTDAGPTSGAMVLMQTTKKSSSGNVADVKAWLANTGTEALQGTNSAGCYYQNTAGGYTTKDFYRDITQFPSEDIYGNRLNPGTLEYQHSHIYHDSNAGLDMMKVRNPYQVGLVSWNATLDAARRIRRDPDLKPWILAIGYHGGDDIDPALMKRIVNSPTDFDADYTIADYDASATTTTGRYYEANGPGTMDAAFRQVASEILRLVN